VIDPVDGTAHEVADPDLGTIVGVDGDVLVTYGACSGLPCPVLAVDLTTGTRHVLAEEAVVAVLATTPAGPRLVHEVFEPAGLSLRSIWLDGSAAGDLGPVQAGTRLHAASTTSGAATTVPSDWVLLAPDGRMPGTGPDSATQLRHISDGTTIQLMEVAQ
jgi:hypothetical protein